MAETLAPAERIATFSSLRNRDYRWYWLGVLFSFAALQIQILARGWLAYQITGSPLVLGLVASAWGFPVIFLALLGGTIADRVAKRSLIFITEGVFALVSLVLAVLILIGAITVWQLVVGSLLMGLTFAFNSPARMAYVPELVRPPEVMNAYALTYVGLNLMRVLAPAAGGLLLARLGVAGVYFLTTALYALGTLTVLLVSVRGEANKQRHSFATDLGDGLRFVARSPVLLLLLGLFTLVTFVGMPYQNLLPVFAVDVLHVGEVGLGWLTAAMGLGALLGTLIVASISNFRHKGWLLLGLAFLFGTSLLAFSLSAFFPLSLAFLFGVGAGNMGYLAVNQTLLQTLTPHPLRGRVSSLVMITFGLSSLGVLGFSSVAQVWGAPLAVGASGIIMLLIVSAACFPAKLRRIK